MELNQRLDLSTFGVIHTTSMVLLRLVCMYIYDLKATKYVIQYRIFGPLHILPSTCIWSNKFLLDNNVIRILQKRSEEPLEGTKVYYRKRGWVLSILFGNG